MILKLLLDLISMLSRVIILVALSVVFYVNVMLCCKNPQED